MADKKPIGHSVKAGNGRDVRMVGLAVGKKGRLKDALREPALHPERTCFTENASQSFWCFSSGIKNGHVCKI